MTNAISDRRKFLIVSPNKNITEPLQENVQDNFFGAQLYLAADGAEAQSKIINDPPHVVFIDQHIKKMTVTRLVEWIVNNKQYDRMALVVLSEIPDREQYVDEVLVGKIQFLDNVDNPDTVLKFTNRALNFIASGDNADFSIRFIASGEELLREGEIGDCVYIVKSGKLEATHISKEGEEVTLGQIDQGEFVGEMSFVNHKPRSASVKALSQCELIEIPMSRLDHLLFKKPAWAKALIATLTKRLEKANALLKL